MNAKSFYRESLSRPFTLPSIILCVQRDLQVYHAPAICSAIFRRDPSRHFYIIRQSLWGSLAFLAYVAPGREFARVTTPGRMDPLGLADLDEVHCFRTLYLVLLIVYSPQ